MFERTGFYFFLLFLILFSAYITRKVCLKKLFEQANVNGMFAFIPYLNRKILIKITNSKVKFVLTLIPIINIPFKDKLIKDMLKVYGKDTYNSLCYIFLPLVYYPRLIWSKTTYTAPEVEEEIVVSETPVEEPKLDENEYYYQPEPEVETFKVEKGVNYNLDFINNNFNRVHKETPKKKNVCPHCGAKLAPKSKICFVCGKKV